MAGFNFGDLASALNDCNPAEIGVSFLGKAKKWETEEEAQEIIKAINECTNLESLNLEGNTLGVEAAQSIGKALEKHPEFKKALFKDLFTGRLKTEIPQALKYLGNGMIMATANLVVLDCSDNALGPNGMTGLVDLIKSPTCYSLQELKLNNCGLGTEGGTMLAKALLNCRKNSELAGNPLKLRVFVAGRNRLENDGAKALAQVFEALGTLEEITMPQNGIYHIGITALANAFRLNTDMRVLNLNDNTIGPKGAESLAYALEKMQNLELINFGDCLLKTKGGILIAEAIMDGHNNLKVLDLGCNEIGRDGGLLLAEVVCNKPYLEQFILVGNQVGSECRGKILEIFKYAGKPETLKLFEADSADEDNDDEDEEEDDDEEDGGEEEEEELDDEYDEGDEEHEIEDGDEYVYGQTDYYEVHHENEYQPLTGDIPLKDFSFNNFNQSTINNSDVTGTNDMQLNVISTFFNVPVITLKLFNSLENNDKVSAIRNYLKTVPEDEYLIHVVFIILKCSSISQESNDALEVAIELFKDCFKFAKDTKQINRVRNFFLIHLGLLKCEDTSFKTPYNVEACRLVVSQAIEQNVFPQDVENSFKFFLQVKL